MTEENAAAKQTHMMNAEWCMQRAHACMEKTFQIIIHPVKTYNGSLMTSLYRNKIDF